MQGVFSVFRCILLYGWVGTGQKTGAASDPRDVEFCISLHNPTATASTKLMRAVMVCLSCLVINHPSQNISPDPQVDGIRGSCLASLALKRVMRSIK